MSNSNLKTKGSNYLTAKDITPDDYGKYVTNYATPCGIEKDTKHGIGGWRIFYADSKNIYLIADDYIYKKYVPKGRKGSEIYVYINDTYRLSMDNVIYDYEGTSDIQDRLKSLNKKYFDKGYTSSYKNMKVVAYMLDTEIWDEKFKNTRFAEYAIGGPSIELFAKSYNQKYIDKRIKFEVESYFGYKLGWRVSDQELKSYIVGLNISQNNIYIITSQNKANAMWLCSPSANCIDDICVINHSGYMGDEDYGSTNPGFRPVVCLKSNIQLQKVENGFEIKE